MSTKAGDWVLALSITALIVGLAGIMGAWSKQATSATPAAAAQPMQPTKQDGVVMLHRLPNGTPCAVLLSSQGNNAITCGWGYKEK